jgi:orotate phosphoribosyltransferase
MSYLPHTHQPNLAAVIATIEDATKDRMDKFQFVLVTGLSGIVPAAIFCHAYGKELVVLRKDGERCHGQHVEGPYHWDAEDNPQGYILIDDFVCSGSSLVRLAGVHRYKMPEFVVLYNARACLVLEGSAFALHHDGHPNRFSLKLRNR